MILNECLEHKSDILRVQIVLYRLFKLGRLLRILLKHGLELGQGENLLDHGVENDRLGR